MTQSLDIVNDNISRLKELFPEVVTEGKIDFKVLQDILGKEVEEEEEYYRFTWAGKAQARREAHKPSTGTLRPAKEESVNWDTTENLYIEGDNLEVLKLLQKSYAGKVKMIYIDPPYNTGKDFVYKDNYKDNLKNYQEITGQVDNEGNKLTTNSDSDGRYHSNWLNMIYPRLQLAKNLLKDDGVIFISLDDNEIDNLKKVCDEIFGSSNFIAKFIHKNNSNKNQANLVSVSCEYFLCYSKNFNLVNKEIWRLEKKGAKDVAQAYHKFKKEDMPLDKILDEIKELYKRPKYAHLSRWNKIDDIGIFMDDNLSREGGARNYSITNPETGKECPIPPRGWAKSKEELEDLLSKKMIYFGDPETPPRIKSYLTGKDFSVPDSFWYIDNSIDTRWQKNVFGSLIFDNPKPLEMLQNILLMCNTQNEIILDFFSGSGTTAHAVTQINLEDGGNRKYIQVQLPEKTEVKSEAFKLGYKTITEIGKERIRRVGQKILEENPDKVKDLDLGFKVFKLDSSNIKGWDGNPDNLLDDLFDSQDNIKTGRTEEDVLFEILLKYGLDLTLPIEEKIIGGKKVFSVGFGALFICLADGITNKVAEGIGAWKEELNPEGCRVIFKDAGFGDVEKTNSVQTLKRFGINEIKSI
ncbi:site-specific DNA-methyltransferase [Flavobacterium ovatum]|uniref:site-specific DNA-methyltransferase n=1 Tax=Flavobacterium ovatum TaxID=1928857 RepID=UPI00344D223C